jgi:7,8-dihydro-6-hydroxymethylpterin-pyrophosphokinase
LAERNSLIYVSINVVSGPDTLKRLVSELKLISWEMEFSSVYRQFETDQRYDFDANMITVVKLGFNTTTEELIKQLQNVQTCLSSFIGKDKVRVIPLAVEQETQMVPDLTLPHPILHMDPLVVRCAAEVWGSYEHPILKRSLSDLANKAAVIENAEFMLQGKSLVPR